MFRIPIIDQNERFLDIDGMPLVRGKVDILDPVSNNPITVWSYADDEFTEHANPVILDIEGRSEQTIFSDRLSYVRAYRYEGLDEWNEPIYVFVRDYYAGEDSSSESREYVIGIDALKALDPSVNTTVNVIGYYNSFDCPLRTYVYDPNSSLDADGGYVIASDYTAEGRWILQFDGEYLPSTYYGVYPGSEANMAALMSYVGQIKGKNTAPGVWMVSGTYSYATDIVTTKKLQMDSNTHFGVAVTCNSVDVVGTPTSPVADFYVSGGTVKSSWYSNINAFLGSGADRLVVDKDNFVTKALDAPKTLTGTYEAWIRLPAVTTSSNYLDFVGAKIICDRSFSTSDYVKFSNMTIKQSWWIPTAYANWDVGLLSQGHHVQATTVSANAIDISDFENAAVWLKFRDANGDTSVDMQGRSADSFSSANICAYKNGSVNTLIYTGNQIFSLDNMHVGSLTTSADVTAKDSYVYLSYYTGSSLNFNKCTVDGTPINCDTTLVLANDCIFNAYINVTAHTGTTSDTNYTSSKDVGISNSTINGEITTKGQISLTNNVINKDVTIYPHKIGNYMLWMFINGNTFRSYVRVKLRNNATDFDVAGVAPYIIVTNNTWDTIIGSDGFDMQLFSDQVNFTYFLGTGGTFIYKGNNGMCPQEHPPMSTVTTGNSATFLQLGGCYYDTAYNYVFRPYATTANFMVPMSWNGARMGNELHPVTLDAGSLQVIDNVQSLQPKHAWVPYFLLSASDDNNWMFKQVAVTHTANSAPGRVVYVGQ